MDEDVVVPVALIVTVPLVVAKLDGGSYAYLYAGTELPSNLADGEAERLLAEGFVTAPVIPEAAPEDAEPGDELDALGLAELRTLAEERGVDLAGLKKVGEIRDLLRAAAAKAAETQS